MKKIHASLELAKKKHPKFFFQESGLGRGADRKFYQSAFILVNDN